MAETGKVRSKRRKFAQVSSHCLRNNNLSLRAKGLYSMIQNYIDIPGYVLYKSVLMDNDCKEGRDVFNKTWKELIEAGYLKVYKINTKKGFVYEYELLDEPEDEASSEPSEGKSSAMKTKVKSLTPGTENPYVGPDTEIPHVGFPDVGNPTPNNTDTNNTDTKNTSYSNDNDIENTLNVVGETEESVVVTDNLEPSSFLSSKEIRAKAKAIQDANVLANESYNCFEDPMFSDSLEYDSTRKALLDFAQYHENAKDFPFFKLKDIASYWTRTAEIYRNPETVIKAEKMLLKVMGSFTKPAEKLAILSMETEDILYLLENLQKYYNSDEESNIVNPQTWTAGSIRPMISAKVYEISGAQI